MTKRIALSHFAYNCVYCYASDKKLYVNEKLNTVLACLLNTKVFVLPLCWLVHCAKVVHFMLLQYYIIVGTTALLLHTVAAGD